MRVSRIISLLLLLQSRGSMTAADLARELEVSERTIYRDVVALSTAGVPVYAEQGRLGGYRLVEGYRTRLTGLSRAEAEALFLAGLPGPARDLGLGAAAAAARLKVTAALPAGLREASARSAQRFHLDAPGWFGDTDPPPLLETLAQAVWQDRTVRLTYRRGEPVTRTADPYGLVLKNGAWYLVGSVSGDPRVYRADRITAAEPTGETFTRDDTFDLAAFWAGRAAEFVRAMHTAEATVRLSAHGLRILRWAAEPPAVHDAVRAAGPPDADGWVTTRLPIESVDVAHSVLLRLGADVEVLDPPQLRDRMRDTAARLAALYR